MAKMKIVRISILLVGNCFMNAIMYLFMFHNIQSLKVFILAMLFRVKWFILNEMNVFRAMFTCS